MYLFIPLIATVELLCLERKVLAIGTLSNENNCFSLNSVFCPSDDYFTDFFVFPSGYVLRQPSRYLDAKLECFCPTPAGPFIMSP